jgi:hypothetical protein
MDYHLIDLPLEAFSMAYLWFYGTSSTEYDRRVGGMSNIRSK